MARTGDAAGPWPVQLRFETGLTSEQYVSRQAWCDASLACCPEHPRGGCSFARHGTYRRKTPPETRIARWYCPQSHTTFSLLPDCLAARLPGTLNALEQVVAVAEQAASLETAIHFACDELDAEYYTDAHAGDRNHFPWLVADVDGDFAGYAKSSVWRERAAYRHTAETTVYVGARFRGLGIARALYLRLFDELRELGFHMAVAGVTLPNHASVRFHQSVGFRPVGTFNEVGRKFDQWHDVAWFERQL